MTEEQARGLVPDLLLNSGSQLSLGTEGSRRKKLDATLRSVKLDPKIVGHVVIIDYGRPMYVADEERRQESWDDQVNKKRTHGSTRGFGPGNRLFEDFRPVQEKIRRAIVYDTGDMGIIVYNLYTHNGNGLKYINKASHKFHIPFRHPKLEKAQAFEGPRGPHKPLEAWMMCDDGVGSKNPYVNTKDCHTLCHSSPIWVVGELTEGSFRDLQKIIQNNLGIKKPGYKLLSQKNQKYCLNTSHRTRPPPENLSEGDMMSIVYNNTAQQIMAPPSAPASPNEEVAAQKHRKSQQSLKNTKVSSSNPSDDETLISHTAQLQAPISSHRKGAEGRASNNCGDI